VRELYLERLGQRLLDGASGCPATSRMPTT
jgi:hypothetical protein